ncbi:hypothetical protein I6N96_12705 [Enterococcus sp. BWM-S5]|uniref:Uncharacterized protein n=1 Tax=Enterococcus larvae TaxID=2794352 RepID=A0ABS4CKX6_9ENTE|nr:hypothetical protein [Enterococcus larvae]MBP1047134.1 hypothetical protein [Enterococcus larvae]
MEIVVTVPKREIDNFEKELVEIAADPELFKHFKLSKEPKKINVVEKIYFVVNGSVKYRANVYGFTKKGFTCHSTGRQQRGKFVICDDFFEVEEKIEVRGFQGFRYKWW